MNLIFNWFISALAILIAGFLLPGVLISGLLVAFILAIVLGAINAFLRPLVVFLTLPINILTLGLFTFVINALLILLAAAIVPGFEVDGFWWAMLFAVVLSIVNYVIEEFAYKKEVKIN